MTLSAAEIESLRYHLGYGCLAVAAETYTPDGFYEIFNSVVSPNLSTGTETTSATAVTASSTTTITVASIGAIAAYQQLVVDVAEQAEVVTVKAVAAATLTAYFTKAHTGTYPVATMSGLARLRLMLHDADLAWRAMTDGSVGVIAGLKSVDKGDVEWFQGTPVLAGKLAHYKAIVSAIASLVQVPPQWVTAGGDGSCRLEAY